MKKVYVVEKSSFSGRLEWYEIFSSLDRGTDFIIKYVSELGGCLCIKDVFYFEIELNTEVYGYIRIVEKEIL